VGQDYEVIGGIADEGVGEGVDWMGVGVHEENLLPSCPKSQGDAHVCIATGIADREEDSKQKQRQSTVNYMISVIEVLDTSYIAPNHL